MTNLSRNNKTILFIMPRLPFPPVSGRKTSLYHYCRIIKQLGYKLVVAAFMEDKDNPDLKPDFIDDLIILSPSSKIEKVRNIIVNSLVRSKYPFQVSLYLSKIAKKQVNNIVKKEKPFAVIADMVRSTEYIRNLDLYRIADLDDRLSLRYKRQLALDFENMNPYGAFIENIPNLVKKILLYKPIRKAILNREINLLERYEINIGQLCDKTIFVAEDEAVVFNNEIGADKAVSIPIGVDVEFFKPDNDLIKKNYVVFLGAMNVAHNENAVFYFLKEIFPMVLKEVPDVVFVCIGGGVSDKLRSFSSDHVFFTDRVNDVRDYLRISKVFVCPLRFGSGIKTKNLEAMSMGLTVVTTSIGAENINAVDGKDWYIEDDEILFAKRVITALNENKTNKNISKNARSFVLKNFVWNITKDKFEFLFNNIVSKK